MYSGKFALHFLDFSPQVHQRVRKSLMLTNFSLFSFDVFACVSSFVPALGPVVFVPVGHSHCLLAQYFCY